MNFSYDDVAARIALSLAIGLTLGMEREWAGKGVGVRTFAIITLLSTLASLATDILVGTVAATVLIAIIFLNIHSLLTKRSLELTSSVAILAGMVLGYLTGHGHMLTSAAGAILVTSLLAWKVELEHFADTLRPQEIRGAVLLGLLAFVIYPLLPNRFIDPFNLINPRQAWVTVVAVAGIGFLNYILLRLYRTRGVYYAALLGSVINGSATVIELTASLKPYPDSERHILGVVLLSNIAVCLRNILLLGVLSYPSMEAAVFPLLCMTSVSAVFAWLSQRNSAPVKETVQLDSPISLRRVLRFGVLFLLMGIIGTLVQRHLGNAGLLTVSFFGGMVSSASTTATAASLAVAGKALPHIAGLAGALSALASAVVNVGLVYQQTRSKVLIRRLVLILCAISLVGLSSMASVWYLGSKI
jgi:uncharacterized membrane protein (DUF4010 family)